MSRKDKISFFISMLLLTIFIAILILVFCWFCYELPVDFPGTVGEWVTALASLAGGALTLGGVWWTIKDNEKARKNDKRLEYKPILFLEPIYDKWYFINKNTLSAYFELKNVGRGEAYDIDYDCKCYFIDAETNKKKEIDCKRIIHSKSDIFIPNSEDTKYLTIIIDIEKIDLKEQEYKLIEYEIYLHYRDLYKEEKKSVELIKFTATISSESFNGSIKIQIKSDNDGQPNIEKITFVEDHLNNK